MNYILNVNFKSNIKYLWIIFIFGLAVSLYYFIPFFKTFQDKAIVIDVPYDTFVLVIFGGIGLQVMGHAIRSYKSSILLYPIKNISQISIFDALCTGFLFNTILPFRIGELIRCHRLGKENNISRIVIFLTVLFERAVDGIFLTIAIYFGAVWIQYNSNLEIPDFIYKVQIGLLTASLCVLLFLLGLKTAPKMWLRFVYRFSTIFNDNIKIKIQFIIWSGIHGVQVITHTANFRKYILLTVLMWVLYLDSVILIFIFLIDFETILLPFLLSGLTYLGIAIPSGPAYFGSFHYYFSNWAAELGVQSNLWGLSIITWSVLILPIMLLGIFFLMWKRNKVVESLNEDHKYTHKLYRDKDVSHEMAHILESYFQGLEIAKILSHQELESQTGLVKTFKGGSNAITSLVQENNIRKVRKTTLLPYADKLIAQMKWLQEMQEYKEIPQVIAESSDRNSYYCDLEFKPDYVPFFDYIHSHSSNENIEILNRAIDFLQKNVHINPIKKISTSNLDVYVQEKIYDKIRDSLLMSTDLQNVIDYPEIVINNKTYDNFSVIMKKITTNRNIMIGLSEYLETKIHGDFTIDNLIANEGNFILLDPNNENYISDPLVDYGKMFQSLHSGYEFLCKLDGMRLKENVIFYEENISYKYMELFNALKYRLKQELLPQRYSLILFHEAVHYFSMLTYRININPKTFLVFYCVAIKCLNKFYESQISKN